LDRFWNAISVGSSSIAAIILFHQYCLFTKTRKLTAAMSHTTHKSVVQDFIRNVTQTSGPRTGFAAYARAVRRYGFETETFVGRNGVVFKKNVPAAGVGVIRDDATESEVPAEDIQNGTSSSAYSIPC
jgi:hypothetical protein